jgi:hypothetical protein
VADKRYPSLDKIEERKCQYWDNPSNWSSRVFCVSGNFILKIAYLIANTASTVVSNVITAAAIYPNQFAAAKIAQVTASKADYTKHRAFDKKYYKDNFSSTVDGHFSSISVVTRWFRSADC